MKNMTFLFLLAILSIAAACNKDDDQPNYHEDIVRCKVNGVEWEAFDYTEGDIGGWGTGATDLRYDENEGWLTMVAVRALEDQSINQSINISARPAQIGNNEIFFKKREFKNWLNSSNCVYYNLDTLNHNEITIIEIDTINQIIIGEFEFSAFNDCGDTVYVTDGYFDIQYRPF